ncbi:uncharacterized protein LOC129722366 [Wyeomyia smithii]|uniref:uncharacterized protein LOC129722366 n=1 Tax=Wyeomyia smithii TaxID=174621 RepID=UPI002467E935|nr:uncharacterized protein LOC129722366 [Wyeomyia smithii]
MAVRGKAFQILITVALCVAVNGRPSSDPYLDYDSDSENAINEVFLPEPSSTTTGAPSTTETTTEYKYKQIAEAYTVKMPELHSIRHAAGTHYFELQPGEDLNTRLLEEKRIHFDEPFSRTPAPRYTGYSAPPKC